MKKQQKFVLDKLINGEKVTSMAMFPFGITRLSAVIFNLRGKGHTINTVDQRTEDGTTYAQYVLIQQARAA